MAHRTVKSGHYEALAERLNKFPQGAPPTELLFKILRMLFSEREALLVSQLPIKPFSIEKAAQLWNLSPLEAQKTLDALADKALLVDLIDEEGNQSYVLPPPMAGFFEFSLMRITDDIDQKVLAELFFQYMNVEEDFIRSLFCEGETQLGRVFVNEQALPRDNALMVLDYERASEVINTASHIGVGVCYCRHKALHVDKACEAPLDICMTFNNTARSLVKHGFAKETSKEACRDLLDKAQDHHLVQFGENIQQNVNFICNCCGCCCEALIAARRFGHLNPVHTTNFLPSVDAETCSGCGRCVSHCPVEAIALVSANDPHKPNKKKAKVDVKSCLGCGVCVQLCPDQCLSLIAREKRVITPVTSSQRVVEMAIERGKLQELIFDQQLSKSHRALAALFGVILQLSPVKRALASEQMKSRYLYAILDKLGLN